MKKLLGIVVMGLLFSNVGVAEIIELTKCYVNKYEDRSSNNSSMHNYNDQSWSEKSYNHFMKEHNMIISNFVIDTERNYFSQIDGTEDNINKSNHKITDYYNGIIMHEEKIFPNDPTSPIEFFKTNKIQINLNTGKVTNYSHEIEKIYDNATDPPRTRISADRTYQMICTNDKSNNNGSFLKKILKMLN